MHKLSTGQLQLATHSYRFLYNYGISTHRLFRISRSPIASRQDLIGMPKVTR